MLTETVVPTALLLGLAFVAVVVMPIVSDGITRALI